MSEAPSTESSPPETAAASVAPPVQPLEAVQLPAELSDRFTPLRELGRGGMGVVLLVRDRRLEREVALKLVKVPDARHAAMFAREARILAGLEHENVVRLYEFGELTDGRQFLVMEVVRGASLAGRMARGRPTLIEAARIAVDVLRGLEEAHRTSIVHRDLKPGNVFLEPTGRAKVADFGLAVIAEPGGESTVGRLAGTPGYMSPEQARAEAVGPASDVYAAGIVLHEMLTGRRLFTGKTSQELLAAHRVPDAPPPSRVNPAVPAALDEVVARALAPLAADRPDAAALRQSLEAWLERARKAGKPAGGALPPAPYKLLEHYETADAAVFFGREAESLELAELLDQPDLRVLLVFAPCGAGKSSLLRAGLVPALDARHDPVVLRGGADPASALRSALCAAAARHGLPPVLPADLEAFPARLDLLLLQLERVRAPVFVLDQAEEVLTLNTPGSPRLSEFFRLAEAIALSPAVRVRLVIAFRTEFRGEFYPLEERLGTQLRSYHVPPIAMAGLVEAVEGPALLPAYGFHYERGLPERIAADVAAAAAESGDAAPPLLSIVCRQLWDAKQDPSITTALYRRTVGGTQGALLRYVEARLSDPAYAQRAAMARQMLKALTLKEEGGERHARSREEAELLAFPDREAARLTLERLIADHLVLRETDAEGRHTLRLVSEVVCPLIDGWQLEPDDAERAARALARAFPRWVETGRPDAELLAGATLDLVSRNESLISGLSDPERQYLRASREHRRRRRARLAGVAALWTALAAVLIWAAYFRPGEIQLDSDPPGARVEEAGRLLGTTPLVVPARAGLHALALSHPGYDPAIVEAAVPSGGRTEFHPVLRYPAGVLSVTSDPQGASLTVRRSGSAADSPPVIAPARTPLTTEVPEGAYRLELRAPGYAALDLDGVAVHANRVMTSRAGTLHRVIAHLALDSPFALAQATIVSRETGVRAGPFPLPLAERALPAGPYRVEVSGPGLVGTTLDVSLTSDQHERVTAWAPAVRPLWAHKLTAEVMAAPALADLDGDGTLDVAVAEKNALVALSGRTGEPLWTVTAGDVIWSSPAVADLDGDGTPDLVFGASDHQLRAVSGKTGKLLWSRACPDKVISSPCLVPSTSGPPGVAVGCDDGVLRAFGPDGTPRWEVRTAGKVRSSPALADLDADGHPAVVFGSADGQLRAVDAASGAVRWTYRAGGEVNGSPAIADLDGDGKPDVVVGAKDKRVHAINHAGAPLWTAPSGDEVRASPAVGDLLGDGRPVVAVGSFDHRLYALDGRTGRELWVRDLGEMLIASPVLTDIDGDGALEVVIGSRDGVLHALSGRSGDPVMEMPLGGPIAAPVALGDLDHDGAREMVVAAWYDRVIALRGRTPRARWAAQLAPLGTAALAADRLVDVDGDGVPDAIAATRAGVVGAVSGRTGRVLWGAPAGGAVPAPPRLVDGGASVLVTRADGGVLALSARDGRKRWETSTGKLFRATPVPLEPERASDLVIGDLVGDVRALSSEDGHATWTHRGPGPVGYPALVVRPAEGTPPLAVVGYAGGAVEALDPSSGRVVWTAALGADALAAPVALPPAHAGDSPVIVLVTGDRQIRGLSARDGKPLWALPLPGGSGIAPLAVPLRAADRVALVVGTAAGGVLALDAATREKLWEAPAAGEVTALAPALLDRAPLADVLAVSADGRLRVLSGQDGALLASVDLVGATASPPCVAALGADARRSLLAMHMAGTLVALPLPGPLKPVEPPVTWDFTSGAGRFRK